MPNVGLEIEEVDSYQFSDVSFTIHAYFKDLSTGQIRTGETSNLKVLLAFEGNASAEFRCKEHHPNLLEVVSNTGIKEDGRATIVLKIKDVSMNHDNKRFVVYLEGYRPHGNNNIIAAITNPITTIKHKLVLTEAYSAPYIWYKDEGAKDKSIKVSVKLIDADQNLVTDRNIPLTVNLIYTSGQIVQPSTVLTIFHDRDNKQIYIGNTGMETIRFRVNEVSRNHRKQLFHLSVVPSDTTLADISPATSIAFEVKSKRSSDARREQANRNDGDDSGDEFIPLANPTPRLSTGVSSGAVTGTSAAHNPVTPAAAGNSSNLANANTNANAGRKSTGGGSTGLNATLGGGTVSADLLTAAAVANIRMSDMPNNQNLTSRLGFPATMLPPPINTFAAAREDIALDTPFKALFSLADWTNVAIRVLTEVRNGGGNNADIQEAATQLMDTYPVRAQSCLQYMQQFLSIQEQYLIQQKPLINILAQQQQVFFNNLESLNPVRSAASPRMSMTPGNLRSGSGYATAAAPTAIAPSGRMHPAGNNAPLGVASSSNGAIPAGASNGRGAAGSSSSRKRGLDMDVAVNLGPLYTGDINNGIPSESMITIILAKRVALTENTDDFGLPAYTTNTPNGVSLLGFYKEMYDSHREDKIWVYRPMQSYEIFHDNDINLAIMEEILELLENNSVMQEGLFFEASHFHGNLLRLKQEAFMKVLRYEHALGGPSVFFLDKLMQAK